MARNNERTDVVKMLTVMEVENRVLYGKSVCITGHLSRPRKEIEELIVQAGGRPEKAVRYGLSYLVTNEDWSKGTVEKVSSKYAKAQKLGVKIISEQALLDMIMEV